MSATVFSAVTLPPKVTAESSDSFSCGQRAAAEMQTSERLSCTVPSFRTECWNWRKKN